MPAEAGLDRIAEARVAGKGVDRRIQPRSNRGSTPKSACSTTTPIPSATSRTVVGPDEHPADDLAIDELEIIATAEEPARGRCGHGIILWHRREQANRKLGILEWPLRDLDRPLFGKTGTTNGPTNVWFVGGTADVVAGIYVGYDQPRDMGNWAQGGRIAAPVFKDFATLALKDAPKTEFRVPPGIRMVRIDRRSGRRVYGVFPTDLDEAKPAVIWEAFKPESEPRRLAKAPTGFEQRATVRSDSDFLQNSGGIY